MGDEGQLHRVHASKEFPSYEAPMGGFDGQIGRQGNSQSAFWPLPA